MRALSGPVRVSAFGCVSPLAVLPEVVARFGRQLGGIAVACRSVPCLAPRTWCTSMAGARRTRRRCFVGGRGCPCADRTLGQVSARIGRLGQEQHCVSPPAGFVDSWIGTRELKA
jgi:hypothetical protein